MNIARTLISIALLALTGCASFPGNVLPKVTTFPKSTDKPSAYVSLSFRQYLNGQPLNLAVKSGESRLQAKLVERFGRSGLYSLVAATNQNPDITITVLVKDEGSGSIGMAFLTGLTLYIVPSSATDLYKVSAIVKNNRTGIESTVELEDFVTQWQEIILLPLLPFTMAPVVANGVQNNIMDTLAIRVHEAATKAAPTSTSPGIVNLSTNTNVPIATHQEPKSEDVLKRLKTLKEAYDSGLISEEEYKTKKSELMNGF